MKTNLNYNQLLNIVNKFTCVFLIVLLLFFSFACKNNRSTSVTDIEKWSGMEFNLMSEEIQVNTKISQEADLCFFDNYLALAAPDGVKEFALFEIDDDKLNFIDSFGTFGKGQYEVNNGDIYYSTPEKKLIIVGYNMPGKSLAIPTDSIFRIPDILRWTVINYDNYLNLCFSLTPISASKYLVESTGGKSMFEVLDVETGVSSSINILKFKPKAKMADFDKSVKYAKDILVKPSGERVVYSLRKSKYVNIFSLSDSIASDETTLFGHLPMGSEDDNGKFVVSPNQEVGFQVSVTDGYIYYSDLNFDWADYDGSLKRNGYPCGFTKTIYTSDWSGFPMRKYILDIPVSYPQADPNDDYLYGFSEDKETGEPRLVRFKLPK